MSKTTPIYVAVVDDDENLCRSLSRLLRAGAFSRSAMPQRRHSSRIRSTRSSTAWCSTSSSVACPASNSLSGYWPKAATLLSSTLLLTMTLKRAQRPKLRVARLTSASPIPAPQCSTPFAEQRPERHDMKTAVAPSSTSGPEAGRSCESEMNKPMQPTQMKVSRLRLTLRVIPLLLLCLILLVGMQASAQDDSQSKPATSNTAGAQPAAEGDTEALAKAAQNPWPR